MKTFHIFALTIVAVISLRTLPMAAHASCFFLYFLAGLLFFIPSAIATLAMVRRYPCTGGSYVWVREAMGESCGLLVAWISWIYNVIWYPAIFSFIASSALHLYGISSAYGMWILAFLSFWLVLLGSMLGLKFAKKTYMWGAVVGVLLPILGLVISGIWAESRHLLQWAPIHWSIDSKTEWMMLLNLIFGLLGIEISAVHAGDVEASCPEKAYQMYRSSVCWTVFLCLTLMPFASYFVYSWVGDVRLLSGVGDAFYLICQKLNIPWLQPILIIFLIFGCLVQASAWILGPSRAFHAALKQKKISWLTSMNRFQAPHSLLCFVGVVASLMFFILFYSPNEGYLFLSVLTAQLALLGYAFIFISCIKMVPHVGVRFACMVGLLTCIAAFIVGLIPDPEHPYLCYACGLGIVLSLAPIWKWGRRAF